MFDMCHLIADKCPSRYGLGAGWVQQLALLQLSGNIDTLRGANFDIEWRGGGAYDSTWHIVRREQIIELMCR